MVVRLHHDKIVVSAAPGTGSTSLLDALADRADPVGSDGERRAAGLDPKHATVTQLIGAGLMSPDHGHTIVTTTRNPFDYWVAEWYRTRTRWLPELRRPDSWVYRVDGMIDRIVDAVELDFDQWIERALGPHAADGRVLHLNPGHVAEADVVLRMEDLDRTAPAVLGLDSIPHHNKTPKATPYWHHYSRRARTLVSTVHAPDLERFGYRF